MEQRKKIADSIVYIVLTVLAVAFLVPIFLVIMNSRKTSCTFRRLRLCSRMAIAS